jgi:hypothetical protein
MGNPLFNQFGQGQQQNPIQNIIDEIQNFKQMFKGDPKKEVEKLMQTGQMSQQQFNQLSQMANQILSILPKR